MKIIASGIRANAFFKQLMPALTRMLIHQEKETNTVCVEIVSFCSDLTYPPTTGHILCA